MEVWTLSPQNWQTGSFESQHHICMETGDGKTHLILKGTIAPRSLRGKLNAPWTPIRLVITIPLDSAISKHNSFSIEQWAPQLTLNGLSSADHRQPLGLQLLWTKLRNTPQTPIQSVQIEAEVQFQGEHSVLHQLNYHIDLLGTLQRTA